MTIARKFVPTRPYDLRDVHQKEQDIPDSQSKVLQPGQLVASQQ